MNAAAPTTTPPLPGTPEYADLIRDIAQGAAARDRDDVNPFDAIEFVRTSRLGALRVPRDEGGGGISLRELFAVLIDLAEADPNVAHILRTHYSFVELRFHDTNPEVRARWLGEVAAGRLFGNASTELGGGAAGDPAGQQTTLTPSGDGSYRLNGTKYFSTGTMFSDWVAVAARDEAARAVLAVVPVKRDGVIAEDDWDGIGQRRTGSGTTRLVGVRVEPDEVLVSWAGGDDSPSGYLGGFAQLWLLGVGAGILRSIVRDTADMVRGRKRSFSHAPVAVPREDPIVQQVVGQLAAAAYGFEAVVLDAATALDVAFESIVDGHPSPEAAAEAALRASLAKVHLDEVGTRAATLLFEAGGASATRRGLRLDRHWRNLRTLASHNPTLYKAQAIGDHVLNGTPLPGNGYF